MHVYESADEIAEEARQAGFDLEYLQLEPGSYAGIFPTSTHSHSVFVDEGHTVGIAVDGTMFDDTCMVMVGHSQVLYNGQSIGSDELIVYMPGSEMHVMTGGPAWIPQVCMPAQVVARFLDAVNPDGPRQPVASMYSIPVGRDTCRWFESSARMLARNEQPDDELAHNLEQRALATLDEIDDKRLIEEEARGRGRPVEYYERTFSRALEYIRENRRGHVSLGELCEATDASLRTVQRIFQLRTGTSPSRYILACKLNAVRRELFDRLPHETTVSAVAREYGLTHMGRFSATYHRLFGEYPKETLARSR